MKVFRMVRKNFASMGFRPKQQELNSQIFGRRQTIAISASAFCSGSTVVYFLRVANSNEEYMYSLLTMTAVIAVSLCHASFAYKNDRIFKFMDAVEAMLNDRSENAELKKIHERNANLVEKFSEFIHFALTYIGLPGFMLPKAIISFYMYFITDAGRDAFDLPFETWFPFDWKNPTGYFTAIILQAIMAFWEMQFLICATALALASFVFAYSLAEDMCINIRSLNQMVKIGQSETDVFQKFSDILSSYSRFKQMTIDFADVFEVTVLLDFMGCTTLLCVVMLVFQSEITRDQVNSALLWKSISFGFWCLLLTFFTCEIGQQFTNTVAKVNDAFEQLDWYLFPAKIQRLLPDATNYIQKPAVIECFGVMDGSRDQFKTVIKVVYKSFNVLRKMFN